MKINFNYMNYMMKNFVLLITVLYTWIQPCLAGLFNPQTFTLKNGLQVVVLENHRAGVVGHSVWYKIGASDDPWGKSGLAHYLEHMMFKGPEGSASAQYQFEISRIGGQQNAATDHDTTHYYAIVATEHLEKVVALESARMRHLDIVDAQAGTELDVILEERNMRFENDPFGRCMEILPARFFYNHPYRLPMIGWEHEIRGLTPQDIRDFYQKWYAPNNAIAIFAGDITLARAKELAEKYYGDIPAKTLPIRQRLQEPPHRDTLEHIKFEAEEVQVPYLIRLYQAPNFKTDQGKHAHSAKVLSYILANEPWGLLYKALVEDQKIATFVQISHSVESLDPNMLLFAAQPTEGHTLQELEQAFDTALAKILKEGINEEFIKRAQHQMTISSIFAHDNVLGGADEIGRGLALGIPLDEIDDWLDRIKAVKPAEIMATANLIFGRAHHLTTYLLPKASTAQPTTGVQK
jgi:zinc protease